MNWRKNKGLDTLRKDLSFYMENNNKHSKSEEKHAKLSEIPEGYIRIFIIDEKNDSEKNF